MDHLLSSIHSWKFSKEQETTPKKTKPSLKGRKPHNASSIPEGRIGFKAKLVWAMTIPGALSNAELEEQPNPYKELIHFIMSFLSNRFLASFVLSPDCTFFKVSVLPSNGPHNSFLQ